MNPKEQGNFTEGLIPYVNTLNIPYDDKAVILIPSNGCVYNTMMVCDFYLNNVELFKKNNVYLVLTDIDKNRLSLILEEQKMHFGMPNLIIDYHENYKNYIENFSTPRLISVSQDSLHSDKIYDVPGLYDLKSDVLRLWEKK